MNIHRHVKPVISAPVLHEPLVITKTASRVTEALRSAAHEGLAGWTCRKERTGVGWVEHAGVEGRGVRQARVGSGRVEREGLRWWEEIRLKEGGRVCIPGKGVHRWQHI